MQTLYNICIFSDICITKVHYECITLFISNNLIILEKGNRYYYGIITIEILYLFHILSVIPSIVSLKMFQTKIKHSLYMQCN